MNLAENYLTKNNFVPKIEAIPSANVGIITVIPCFNEPSLIDTLQSLWNCTRPNCGVEIIIVINHSEIVSPEIITQNEKTYKETSNWINQHNDPKLQFHIIYTPNQPVKHAGVGLARKTGMDEAVYRFSQINKPKGIIVGFDADSICDTNYLKAIEQHFEKNPKTPGASIYFEHPLEDTSFDPMLLEGIIQYELHLRYINQGLRFAGHPHAYHTVGSSYAVRSNAYVKQGGMNQRQAGEDFYFIQKIIALGNYTEINTTRVVPSSRVSDRVPFGTGAALKKWMELEQHSFNTYNIDAFIALKSFIQCIEIFFQSSTAGYPDIITFLHPALIDFLESNNYIEEINRIKQNTNSQNSFNNQFFNWFNVFKIIRFLNTSHTSAFKMMDVLEASDKLFHLVYPNQSGISGKKEMLILYREVERKGEILTK